MDDKVKRTLKCMILGSLLYNIALVLISIVVFIFIYRNRDDIVLYIVRNEICVLIGFIFSAAGLYSMATSLTKAVSANDEKYAKSHMILMSLMRLAVFSTMFITIIKVFGISGAVMFALSVLGIKAGAYLVPFIEKRFI